MKNYRNWLATMLAWACFGSQAAWALDEDAAFLAAREAFQKGRIDRLDELAADLGRHPLYPYIAYWQLRARLAQASEQDVQAFLAQHADTLAAQRLRADWLKQLGGWRAWDEFEREHRGYVLDDAEITCYALQARVARGDLTALAQARPLWFQGTPQPESCGALFDQMVERGDLTQEDVWARLRLALEANNVSFAKTLSAYLPADKRMNGAQLDSVARKPQKYLERRPLALKTRAQRELAMYATWKVALGLPAVAATRLEKYASLLPTEERAYVWAQVATAGALRHRPEALDWFKRADGALLSDRQLAWKARTGLRLGDWETVLAALEAMSEAEREHPVWRYWRGRALQARGRDAEGHAVLSRLSFEHHFYGQLAAEDLGAPLSALPPAYQPGAEEVAAVERMPGVQRALRFYQLGLRYEGALEWTWTTRAYGDRQLLAAAEVAQRAGWYERAIHTAERTQYLHDFNLRFPTPFREVVNTYTQQLELEEAWVYGLVRQESRFVVDARSSAGAQGLMQLMPATARQMARRLGLAKPQTTVVDTNINLGTYYLRELMDRTNNQPLLASAAYNAGLSRARVWRADKPMEGAVYAETIPFNETRDYVRKVMSNTMYYARLFGQQYTALRERLGTVEARPLAND